MKKIFVIFILCFLSLNLFSQENNETLLDESQINTIFANFVAGSLFDKVEIVKSVEVDSVPQTFFEESLQFALENKTLIENHPAYFPLILSSIKKLNSNGSDKIDDLLLQLYKDFSDYNVQLAILKAFSRIKIDNPEIPVLVKGIISEEVEKNDLSNLDFFVASIEVFCNVKYIDAFDVIFNCYKKNISCKLAKRI